MRSKLLFRTKHGSWRNYLLVRKQFLLNGYLKSSEMLKVSLKNTKQELLFEDSHKLQDWISTRSSVSIVRIESNSNNSRLSSNYQSIFCTSIGKSNVELYVTQSEGFCDTEFPDKVLCLNKSLYGLKQAPRIWYLFLCGVIIGLGFVQLETDSCIYIRDIIVEVYVDDIKIVGPIMAKCEAVYKELAQHINIEFKGLSKASSALILYAIGISILSTQSRRLYRSFSFGIRTYRRSYSTYTTGKIAISPCCRIW